jgi:predicted  nucleic acid-binding Zn-ribbon protein
MTEQQLLDLKERVEDAKTQVAELNGQQTALMNQLKNDWGCKTIEEANTKLKGMENSISILEKKIERGVKELEEKYQIEEG